MNHVSDRQNADLPHELLQAFLQETENFIWVLDSAGSLVFANCALLNLAGRSGAHVFSLLLSDLFSQDSVILIQGYLRQRPSLRRAGCHSILTLRLPAGETCPVDSTITPLQDSTGKISYIVGIGRAILPEVQNAMQQREEQVLNAALLDISHAFSTTVDVEQLLDIILKRIQKLIPFVAGSIIIPEGNKIGIAAFLGHEAFHVDPLKIISPHNLSELVNLQTIAETRAPMIIPDVTQNPGWKSGEGGEYIKSWIGIPILAHDAVVGFISLDHTQEGFFNETHARHLVAIAGQASIALQNSLLFDQTRKKIRETSLLIEIASAVASSLDKHEITRKILEQMMRVIPMDTAAIFEMQGEDLVLTDGIGFENREEVIGLHVPFNINYPNYFVITGKKPLLLGNARQEYPVFSQHPHQKIKSWMGVPLIAHGEVIGNIACDSFEYNHFTPEHARLASAVADQVAVYLQNGRLFEEVRTQAMTDSLTSLFTRRQFMALGAKEFERSLRYGHPLSVLMLDFDYFKRINDEFGHPAGDHVLQQSALIIKQFLRNVDIVGRYGGEEFLILLPETSEEKAFFAADRIRLMISGRPFLHDGKEMRLTVSIGLTTFTPPPGSRGGASFSLEHLIECADKALYRAKNAGRDQVAIFRPEG